MAPAIYDWRERSACTATLTRLDIRDSTLVDDIGERHNHGTHRIVCWTFDTDFDINDPNMDVHHRDGVHYQLTKQPEFALTEGKAPARNRGCKPWQGSKRLNAQW
jgi:hypothetical protein